MSDHTPEWMAAWAEGYEAGKQHADATLASCGEMILMQDNVIKQLLAELGRELP